MVPSRSGLRSGEKLPEESKDLDFVVARIAKQGNPTGKNVEVLSIVAMVDHTIRGDKYLSLLFDEVGFLKDWEWRKCVPQVEKAANVWGVDMWLAGLDFGCGK